MEETNIKTNTGAAADNLGGAAKPADQAGTGTTTEAPKKEPTPGNPAPADQAAAAALAAAKKDADKKAEGGDDDTPWYKDWTTYAWIAGGAAVIGLGIWAACALTSKDGE